MTRRIIAWSMQLRLVILAAAAVLMFYGFTQLGTLPVDVLPEFARPYVEVQTEALGLSASEVEALITVPLEADMLNGVPWVDEIRSESIPGLSSVVMFFEPGVDMLAARQVVGERLLAAHALPNVSTPPVMLQPVSSANRFMAVGLTSQDLSLIELSVASRWTIVPRLMGVPGVAQVSIWGQRKRQLQVQVDPETLRDNGVTLQQIINTAGNALWASPLTYLDASTPGTGGWIETPAQRMMIQHLLPISTPDDLAKVTVEGTSLPLGAITRVVEDHQPLIGDAVIDSAPSLMLVIEKFPWANTTAVTAAVEDAVESLQLGLPGVTMDTTFFRPATYLDLAVGNLSTALSIAAVLLAIAFFVLLVNWRTALVGIIAVCTAAAATVTVLLALDVAVNAMVIAGLMVALLALIDDAVVDIQNIARRLRAQDGGEDVNLSARGIFEAAVQTRGPIFYATAAVALAVAPLLLLQGMAGAFATPIVQAYALGLLASLVTALTVTPAVSVLLLAGTPGAAGAEPPLTRTLAAGYGAISGLARTPATVMAAGVTVVGVIVAGALWAMPTGVSTLPQFRERDVVISVDGAPGTSEHAMRRMAAHLSQDLRELTGVRAVSAHVGRAVLSDKTSDINEGEIWVSMNRAADYDATLESIRAVAAGYPGFDIDVDTFLGERLLDEVGPAEKVVVRVYGDDDVKQLLAKAEEVRNAIAGIDGVASPEVQYPDQHPNLEIEPNLVTSRQHGIKPGDVRRAAAVLLGGIEVGALYEEQKVFDVVVWGIPEVRHSVSSVENLLIDKPGGGHVRLREVADTRIAPQPPVIRRDAVARHIDVDAEVDGRSVGAVAADVTERIRGMQFPLEYRAEVLGAHVAAAESAQRLRWMSAAAALGVLLLMQAAFGSWGLGFFVLLSMPVALLGGIATGMLAGGLSTLGALLGLLAVFALALRSAMTLIGHYRHLEHREGVAFGPELVARGTQERFAGIATTAILSILAFLPFAFLGNVAGLEILHAMAVVVIGGVVSSTLVSLIVIPSLYLGFGGGAEGLDIIVEEEAA